MFNGLFSVSKDEIKNGVTVGRLIMNHLLEDEVMLTSSEDLRCFFYLFEVPASWSKYIAFGRQVPEDLIPEGGYGKRWYLTGTVLPMGYPNSVGIAHHIHRSVVQRALGSMHGLGRSVEELRHDQVFSGFPDLFRIYLDNFD